MAALSDQELAEWTGLTQPAAQARKLREDGIGYRFTKDRKVKTTWEAINHALTHGVKGDGFDLSNIS